jgi:hypothetical protein
MLPDLLKYPSVVCHTNGHLSYSSLSLSRTRVPEPPVFQTVAEERLHRKHRLASAFRLFPKIRCNLGCVGRADIDSGNEAVPQGRNNL